VERHLLSGPKSSRGRQVKQMERGSAAFPLLFGTSEGGALKGRGRRAGAGRLIGARGLRAKSRRLLASQQPQAYVVADRRLGLGSRRSNLRAHFQAGGGSWSAPLEQRGVTSAGASRPSAGALPSMLRKNSPLSKWRRGAWG
jgi:hypothetical protein